MNPLRIIHSHMPDWAQFSSMDDKAEALQVVASPPLGGGVPGDTYTLTIQHLSGIISVSEAVPETKLPAACPERHINSDSSFCIGLNVGRDIMEEKDAEWWWKSLASFLKNQRTASRRRYWPRGQWLSHGSAADDHIAMEEIAEELGWGNEITAAIEDKEGWLGGELPRHRKKSDMLVNQRSPCPRGCHRAKGKRAYPVLRRDCPHRQKVSQLVRHENNRRTKGAKYIQGLLDDGLKCCGTMDNCPLQQSQ